MGAMGCGAVAPHAVGKQYAQLQQRRAFSTSYDAAGSVIKTDGLMGAATSLNATSLEYGLIYRP